MSRLKSDAILRNAGSAADATRHVVDCPHEVRPVIKPIQWLRPFPVNRTVWLLAAACLLASMASSAALASDASAFPVDQLKLTSILARRAADVNTYVLVGTGFFRVLRTDDADEAVARWIGAHASAVVTPESSISGGRMGPLVYAWVSDGSENLQVSLVRDGIFPGGAMVDPVEYLTSIQSAAHLDPASSDFPKRLVSDEAYASFRKRVVEAETAAKQDGKGVWSDRYKDLREEEGVR